jgi:hypothetical protein
LGITSAFRYLTHSVPRRRKWRNDVIKRLDELAKVQAATAELEGELAKMHMEMTKVQIEKMQPPSKPGWVLIIFCLAASAALVVSSVKFTVDNSAIDSQAAALRQKSQTDRLQANQLLTIAGVAKELAGAKAAAGTQQAEVEAAVYSLSLSHKENVAADRLQSSSTRYQLQAQMSLAVGSAFFGAMLGWIITQVFEALRFRRRHRTPSS